MWTAPANFHDADIQVDAILGHPWLRHNRLGILHHLQALAIRKGRLILLRGQTEGEATGGEEETEESTTDSSPECEPLRWLDKLRAMRLTLPCEAGDRGEVGLFEEEDTMFEVAHILGQATVSPTNENIRGTIIVPEGEEVTFPIVYYLRVATWKDFENVVLSDGIWE